MPVYRVPVVAYATLYVRADNADAAYEIANAEAKDACVEVANAPYDLDHCEVEVSTRLLDDPELPTVSLSPAITLGDIEADHIEEA